MYDLLNKVNVLLQYVNFGGLFKMKKTAILISVMIMVLSVTFCVTGCGNGETEATEPTATPIATVAPTATPTVAPTTATATQPTSATATVPTSATATQPATFSAQLATGATSTAPTDTTSEDGENTEATASPYASSSVGSPDANGNYTLTGTVTGFGGTTVVMMLGDGNEYEFNYSGTDISYSDLYEGATITVIADGDPSGAGVPNALTLSIG